MAGVEITIDQEYHWEIIRNCDGSPKWIRPIDTNTEFGEVPEDEPGGAPEADAAEGAEQEEKPAEIIAPAQIMPEPEQTSPQEESDKADSDNENYSKAVADAGEKLEEIRRSYEEQNWMKMSEQLLSLGFIVNQLKVMQTIYTREEAEDV